MLDVRMCGTAGAAGSEGEGIQEAGACSSPPNSRPIPNHWYVVGTRPLTPAVPATVRQVSASPAHARPPDLGARFEEELDFLGGGVLDEFDGGVGEVGLVGEQQQLVKVGLVEVRDPALHPQHMPHCDLRGASGWQTSIAGF